MKKIPTGIDSLDRMLDGGLRQGSLTVIGGRPGIGKTSIALKIAGNIADSGFRVLFFSLEMTEEFLKERLKRQCFNCPVDNLIFSDLPGTQTGIKEVSEIVKEFGNIDVVLIDYLQLFDYNRKYDKAGALKALAADTGVAIVITSQLPRRKEPATSENRVHDIWSLDDAGIRRSGTLEQNADVILFPYRGDYYTHLSGEDHYAGLIVSKTPSGEIGFIPAEWNGSRVMFDFSKGKEVKEKTKTDENEELLVIFRVEGQFTAYINAGPEASLAEVEGLAMERWFMADFGEIHHIHGDIDHIENMYGDRF